MDLTHLTRLLDEHGLSEHQDAILATVRPALFMQLAEAESGQPGQSRIGGVPDLPASLAWPKDPLLDHYLCFILQINLAELPKFSDNPLPTSGMLYLFADEDGDYAEQVVVYRGSEALQPAQLPDDAVFITDWYDDLVTHRLTFRLSPELPCWATTDYEALREHISDEDFVLHDINKSLAGASIGKLLGHVSGIGHDPRTDAFVVREVNHEWRFNYEQRATLDMTPAQRWRNLLQVDTSHAVNLMFGDAGYLHILIHDEDLQRQDFSRVYVNLESS